AMRVAICQSYAAARFTSVTYLAEKLNRARFVLRHPTAKAIHPTKIHARPQISAIATPLIKLNRARLIPRDTKAVRVNDPQVIAARSVVPAAGPFQQRPSLVFILSDSSSIEVINSQRRAARELTLFAFRAKLIDIVRRLRRPSHPLGGLRECRNA